MQGARENSRLGIISDKRISMNQNIKFIIFDWSGVISNDLEATFQTYNLLFKHYGFPEMSLVDFQENFELPYSKFCSKYLKGVPLEELQNKFRKLFNEIDSTPKPIPGVAPVLKKLQNQNIKMAVLSSHPYVTRETKEFFPGENFFSHIFEDIPNKQDIIHFVLKETAFSKKETLYVGDMVHDIEAGKHAGVKTGAILTGYQSHSILSKANPDFIIKDLSEILTLLD